MTVAAKQTRNDRYQILALSGGGYRGLFTAGYLVNCEEEFRPHWTEKFNLIAGTSIGALLAAGLALDVPAKDLKESIIEHGPIIFNNSIFGFIKQIFTGARYDTAHVRAAITKVLGERANTPLSEINAPLMICAVNYTHGTTEIFRSYGLAGSNSNNITVIDAVLASSAAPTFFPLFKIGTDQFADGGLVANAPNMAAILESISRGRALVDAIYVLSIGTASRRQGAELHDVKLRLLNFIPYLFSRRIIQTTMAAQESLAMQQAGALLRTNHYHVDEEPGENQVSAISRFDKADKLAENTLLSLADLAFTRTKSDRTLRDFFN